ncbi:hypothetical protein Aperf_G00000048489 [Anoplocephala perfoliata]
MLSYFWPFKSNVENSVEEAINAENKGRILKYSKFLEYFTVEKLNVGDFIEQSRKIYLAEIDELKSMNFTNLVLMLYSCCGSEFHGLITENKNLNVLLEILNSMSRINNIASKKLALFIKFVDSRKSSKFSNHPLLESLDPEDFHASSWVPEMSFDEATQLGELLLKKYSNIKEFLEITNSVGRKTDIEKVHEAKLKADAYCSQLEMDHTFLQDVVQSFLPLENMTNALDRFLLQAGERSASINELLRKRSGKETYQALESNFIERYNKQVKKEEIETRINSTTDEKQLETIKVEILPLISNIEEDHRVLDDLSKRENIQKGKKVKQIFEWSQRTKKRIDELSQQSSGNESYQVRRNNFIKRCSEIDMKEIEARIESATDQKQFETILAEILPLVSSIEEDYQFLNDLPKRKKSKKFPNKRHREIFEWSQQIQKQIVDLSKAFSEFEPENHHLQLSTGGLTLQQRSGKENYHFQEMDFIERLNKEVDKGRIEARIDSAIDQKQLETVKSEILPLIANIEEGYQVLIDLSKRENVEKSPSDAARQIFEWSQRIKSQINDLSEVFRGVEPGKHNLQPFAFAPTNSLSSSKIDTAPSTSKTKTLSMETFQCPHCAKMFYSHGFLQTHLNLEHVILSK